MFRKEKADIAGHQYEILRPLNSDGKPRTDSNAAQLIFFRDKIFAVMLPTEAKFPTERRSDIHAIVNFMIKEAERFGIPVIAHVPVAKGEIRKTVMIADRFDDPERLVRIAEWGEDLGDALEKYEARCGQRAKILESSYSGMVTRPADGRALGGD